MSSLWANYTLRKSPARGLGFGPGIRYIGSSYGDVVNSFKVPGFTLVDASMRYDFNEVGPSWLRGYKVQINAMNLFDKTYVSSCTYSTNCWYGYRRAVYATLKYRW